MGEVPAADRAAKDDVADQRQLRGRVIEYNVAGRMARAVAHIEGDLANCRLVAVSQPARRLERLARDAVLGAVVGETLDPVDVGFVWPLYRNAEFLGEYAGAPTMVDMAVGQQDLLDRDAGLSGGGVEARQVAAGVDERAAHGRCAPQQRAVLLERRDRDDGRAERRLRFAHFHGS